MFRKWMKLAGTMLEKASGKLASEGCNDWKWPEDWTPQERMQLVGAMMVANFKGRPISQFTPEELEELENFCKGDYGPPNWWIAVFIGRWLGDRSCQ
jgi:hypothetical protein